MTRHLARTATRIAITAACIGLFFAVNHHGATKVAAFRCAHGLPGHCATAVRR